VNGEDVRVAVADGKVAVASQELSQPVELDAGRQLHFDNVAKRAVTSAIKTDAVGAWREGRLTYAATPLALVSADLSRYAGVELTVPTELKDRQFSGTLAIGDGKTAIRDLSQLMGLALVPVDGGYRLDSRAD
jgi:transmembrane sensor